MNLILWRHAEAEDGPPDLQRRLTAKGQHQARATGRWLAAHLPHARLVLCSPAQRARETADGLGRAYRVEPALSPGAVAADYLAAAGWPKGPADASGTVVLVGHQPAIGRVASLLLAGRETDWSVRKGAAWWFALRDNDAVLRAVVDPELAGD